jgi:roadblock/LC7 domain-containing protein
VTDPDPADQFVSRDARSSPATVVAQTPATVVVDVRTEKGEEAAKTAGLPSDDAEEFILHFTATVEQILEALLPVLGDALGRSLAPTAWWALSAGDSMVIVSGQRIVVVPRAESEPFVRAVGDGGLVGTERIW